MKTAEEFFKNKAKELNSDFSDVPNWIILESIEFAKLHVQAALKVVSEFINDEDNHTEGELGNSCIDIQSLVNFINQFKTK